MSSVILKISEKVIQTTILVEAGIYIADKKLDSRFHGNNIENWKDKLDPYFHWNENDKIE